MYKSDQNHNNHKCHRQAKDTNLLIVKQTVLND